MQVGNIATLGGTPVRASPVGPRGARCAMLPCTTEGSPAIVKHQVSINEFVLELSVAGPVLFGGRCRDCGNHTFPVLSGCPRCTGTDIERVPLGARGSLWGWTVQGFPPKDPPYLGSNDPQTFAPFGVGYVELPEVIVEARLTEAEPAKLAQGMPMALTVEPLFEDDAGREVVTFAFEPAA